MSWTQREKAERRAVVRALRAEGCTYKEIAQALGVSTSAVKYALGYQGKRLRCLAALLKEMKL